MLALALATAFWARPAQATEMAHAALRTDAGTTDAATPLQALLDPLRQGSEATRLERANRFFNQHIAFGEDSAVWGQADYWASPLEVLARGAGDCEDYAIAKYLSLVGSGVPASRLRLVYMLARTGQPGEPAAGQAHMVLAYYAQPGADPRILDNLVAEILPASRRPDLTPVFSFNDEGLWQGIDGPRAGDPLARLSRWRTVLAKARTEGFQ